MLVINELKCPIDFDHNQIQKMLAHKYHFNLQELKSFEIIRRSIDARKDLKYVYQVLVELKNEDRLLKYPNVKKYQKLNLDPKHINNPKTVIIVGYGPSGIFAAHRLTKAGLRPIVFEKGKRIEQRVMDVDNFINHGIFNHDSNIQFGEGGAGTFSDAKLTTRIKNPMIDYILDTFIKHGASFDIKLDAHPHIGTDVIRKVITSITDELISENAIFHFEEAVVDFIIEDNQVKGVKTSQGEYYSDYVILAAGHSAYDIAKVLKSHDVKIFAKDLAIGFRVEHPQTLIDDNQYHDLKKADFLGHAEYFLRHTSKHGRGVYSFCMCPGGIVMPSNSDLKTIVTNGMSYSKRDSGIANSAILAQVSVEDFPYDDCLAGFDFLHHYEKKAYEISNSYKALAMNIKDYINGEINPLIFKSSYPLSTHLYDFNDFFDQKFNEAFKEALLVFDHQIKGFIDKGIMVGPETRSSSPIRILRDQDCMSVSHENLYPCGEGSGYGGGIISCALDGIRVADKILDKLS